MDRLRQIRPDMLLLQPTVRWRRAAVCQRTAEASTIVLALVDVILIVKICPSIILLDQ
jgi:hypothetical protein